MPAQILGFSFPLYYLDDPFVKNDVLISRFSSLLTVEIFNDLNFDFYLQNLKWKELKNDQFMGLPIPITILKNYPIITTSAVLNLENKYNQLNKTQNEEKFDLVFSFLDYHSTTASEVENYWRSL